METVTASRTAETRQIEDIAKRHGAQFSRVCGAGGGGAIAIYHPPEKAADIEKALKVQGKQVTNFAFDAKGLNLL